MDGWWIGKYTSEFMIHRWMVDESTNKVII